MTSVANSSEAWKIRGYTIAADLPPVIRPVWSSYRLMRRSVKRGLASMEPRWKRFDNFVTDVGIRPDRARLERIDESKPFGPNNFKWTETFSPTSTTAAQPSRSSATGAIYSSAAVVEDQS